MSSRSLSGKVHLSPALGGLVVALGAIKTVHAVYDNTRYDNLAVYWGQNSYGAVNSGDTANFQQTISFYCQDDTVNAIPVAFVDQFDGTGGEPVMNLANTCNNVNNATFSGTAMPDCSALAADVQICQAAGKIVTISLGGGGASVGFQSDADGTAFANTIWDMYLGGSGSIRPLGDAVLDGVDLDIEQGGSTGYAAFVTQIRTLAQGANKPYYITGAPQCPYPDANLGSVINAVGFDAIYVQFYNNQCGLDNYNVVSDWDFGVWDWWANNVSPNPDVKIFIGAPAGPQAAGSSYEPPATLSSIATTMRNSFPSFGGVMLWDASQAWANDDYQTPIKSALTAAGGTGFTYPACSGAPAFATGTAYEGGAKVSYNGYIWEAEYYADAAPDYTSSSNAWSAISACSDSGSGSGSQTTTSTSSSGSSSSSSSTSTTTSTGSSGSSCSGVSAWSASVAYSQGAQVSYNGSIWTATGWNEDEVPGGSAQAWTQGTTCNGPVQAAGAVVSASKVASVIPSKPTAPVATNKNSRVFRL